jgi:crotonobetainyl-CoA:carnitine CoA-transferase CaiB-like acyl-CoA transferase
MDAAHDLAPTHAHAQPPLAGVRVVDLSRYLPGPFCTLQLAWLGAEVTVLERPPGGEPVRSMPPLASDGTGLAAHALLRGKRTEMVDLAEREGLERALELCRAADVVVESFRPGVAERLGVGPKRLLAERPELVYASLSGYGQDGPWAHLAGHDSNYEAVTGLLARTGPAERPVLPPLPLADLAGGSLAATAICAALLAARSTGRGGHIDISLTEAALAWQSHVVPSAATPDARREGGLLTGGLACYSVYECRDGGHVAVAPIEPKFFVRMCELLHRPELARMQYDPRAQDELRSVLAEIFASEDATTWEQLLGPDETCVTRVVAPSEVASQPQLAARDALTQLDVEDGHGARAWAVRSPFVIDGTRTDLGRMADSLAVAASTD